MRNDFSVGQKYGLNRTGIEVVATMLPVSKNRSSFGYLTREDGEVRCYEILDGSVSPTSMNLNIRTSREFPLDESQEDVADKILERAGL